ncbi:CalY family protein [Cytobacillus spongiae]|uniref:CalY family protein n=1 Tax=Cytobacillus spongiae TaxID=2901381 RepID=UPI001F2FD811|nr:CalY family protein [Cytobacillus spongiae]UII56513.1 CalY family protein [Cytobacillus spongiae]
MSIKTKLGMGIASAALGLSLIGGGTFAYFNDTAETTSKFTAGTLDLNASPTTIIDIGNLKPGDWMTRSFNLHNNGSLDIARVLLKTDYTVTGAGDNAGDDFGKHIRVNFLYNSDKETAPPGSIPASHVIYSTTLFDLKSMTPDAVENKIFVPFLEENDGLKAGTSDKLYVQFEFVDNGNDQNHFQGDSLQLKWTFEGKQGAGERK